MAPTRKLPGPDRPRSAELAGFGLLAALTLLVGSELARPLPVPAIAFDSQVSVYHFELIVQGKRLDYFLTVTSKPLMTVIDGTLHRAFGGWSGISLATILAYTVGVVLTAALARRVAGSAAAVVAGVGIAMAPYLVYEVGVSLATPWALPLWAGSALAVTARVPRYAFAGLLLAMATLVRLETVILTGCAVVSLIVAWLASRASRTPAPPSRAWLTPLVALVALPFLAIHDVAISGDPLYWTKVAGVFSELAAVPIPTPGDVVRLFVARWATAPLAAPLAVIGIYWLAVNRRWALLVGLVALGPTIIAALLALAARGIYVDRRYLAAPELVTCLAAGIGFGAALRWTTAAAMRSRGTTQRVAGLLSARAGPVVVAALLALLIVPPYFVRVPGVRGTVGEAIQEAIGLELALPIIRVALASPPDPPAGLRPLIVPRNLRYRAALDLDLPESQVGRQDPARFHLGSGFPAAGQVVVHTRFEAVLAPDSDLRRIEVSAPAVVDGVPVAPLLANEGAGIWVVRIGEP